MESEANKFISLIENKELKLYVDSDREIIESLFQYSSLYYYEKPDMVLVNNSTVLLIEHFQVDSSKFIQDKGNLDKVEKFKRKVKFDEYSLNLEKKSVHLSMKVECEYTKDNYINNLIRCFIEHYNNIDSYVMNIKNDKATDHNKDLKISFYIEDTNPLGSYYFDEKNDIQPIIIFFLKEFYDLLKGSFKVNYVFFSNYFMDKHHIYFISNYENSLNHIFYRVLDIKNKQFYCFDPMETAYREILE